MEGFFSFKKPSPPILLSGCRMLPFGIAFFKELQDPTYVSITLCMLYIYYVNRAPWTVRHASISTNSKLRIGQPTIRKTNHQRTVALTNRAQPPETHLKSKTPQPGWSQVSGNRTRPTDRAAAAAVGCWTATVTTVPELIWKTCSDWMPPRTAWSTDAKTRSTPSKIRWTKHLLC